MLILLTPVIHSNFISTAKAVRVLSYLDLIYGHSMHIPQQPSDITFQLSQLSFPHVSRNLIVTPKENRQYFNNVSLCLALSVRHIVTHTRMHNFLSFYLLAVHGVPSS
jgi:hypothetical protein